MLTGRLKARLDHAAPPSTWIASTGTATDDIDAGDLPSLDPRQRSQVHRVNLDQVPRLAGVAFVPGDAGGIGAQRAPLSSAHGMGLDEQASPRETRQDAANTGFGEDGACRPQHEDQLRLAIAREALPQVHCRCRVRVGRRERGHSERRSVGS